MHMLVEIPLSAFLISFMRSFQCWELMRMDEGFMSYDLNF
jgi:hypothetical protein